SGNISSNYGNDDNANRNPEPREDPIARKCSYKEFMSCQPFNFKGSEGAIRLIRWFERTESMFFCSNYTEDCKVKFSTGDDLKTYVRRFQELETLCPTMVPNSEKLLEAFIRGLPQSIKGNVTSSKPQTLDEAINIAQRLMDQATKHTPGCALTLLNQPFEIDLMPIKLSSFDVVIGMDWLSKNHAKILCDEKVVHIPIDGKTLIIRDYDCEIHYHLGQANVIADALIQKERIKLLRVRALIMTIHLKLPSQILKAQNEALKEETVKAENLRGMDKSFEIRPDRTRCIKN
nr:reverse transcriptase domain-containing protein [Tanacetum cinerariifolium]GEZ16422.1 reverse transcriptase domain-containing protein [Tanacetum cinerariifolium]